MKKALEVLKKSILAKEAVEDRVELQKRSRPNLRLHRGQLKEMLRWEQNPIVAYK